MKEDSYDAKAAKVLSWLKDNDVGHMHSVIVANVESGQNAKTDEHRDKYWTATRALLSTLDNPPRFSVRPPALNATVQAVLDAEMENITEGAIAYFNTGNNAQILTKRGGGLYESAEDYAASQVKTSSRHMTKRYKDGVWDGTVKGLNSQTFPVEEDSEE